MLQSTERNATPRITFITAAAYQPTHTGNSATATLLVKAGTDEPVTHETLKVNHASQVPNRYLPEIKQGVQIFQPIKRQLEGSFWVSFFLNHNKKGSSDIGVLPSPVFIQYSTYRASVGKNLAFRLNTPRLFSICAGLINELLAKRVETERCVSIFVTWLFNQN